MFTWPCRILFKVENANHVHDDIAGLEISFLAKFGHEETLPLSSQSTQAVDGTSQKVIGFHTFGLGRSFSLDTSCNL